MKKQFVKFTDLAVRIGAVFLLAFIPLYPKLPLFDVVHTWVYIRLEDFLVALVAGLFVLNGILRKKIALRSPITVPILLYLGIGFVSLLHSLIFLHGQIPDFFPHLAILHYLRRIEYMMMFFIVLSTIRRMQDVYLYIGAFLAACVGVVLYGFGQKLLGFPAFLTMNEEFAKGLPLYLSATSRITSTFAGHYDLAAFLVLAIPIIGSLLFGIRHILLKIGLIVLWFFAFILLLFTASRVSFGVYIIAVSAMFWWHHKKLFIIPFIIVSILLLQNVSGASERFAKTFRLRQILFDVNTGKPVAVVTVGEGGQIVTEKVKAPGEEDLPIGSGYINVPEAPIVSTPTPKPVKGGPAGGKGVSSTSGSAPVAAKGETPLVLSPEEELRVALEKKQLFAYHSTELATGAGEIATVSGSFYLQKALVYDISFTTRFQGEWPKAIEAFQRNIFLGSGYSSLSLAADSDYFRALGETGILGFVSFISIFVLFYYFVFDAIPYASPFMKSVAIGFQAGLVGLYCNAVLIDVFEASKVAFAVWPLMGVTVGGLLLTYQGSFDLWKQTKKALGHPVVWVVAILIATFFLYRSTLESYFVADDFTWLAWAARSYTRDIAIFFTDAHGFFYRPLTKLYFFGAFSLFWLRPLGYHVVNIVLHALSTFLVYLLSFATTKKRRIAMLSSVFFLFMAIHHENVIWISGLSSLAGSFFGLFALYCGVVSVSTKRGWWTWFLSSFLCAAIAMLFYEGMVFVPCIVVLSVWLFGNKQQRLSSCVLLVLLPGYAFLRMAAHAISPSGSYGIHWQVLPWNIIGNTFGYTLMTLFGPDAIPLYTGLREFMRQAPVIVVTVVSSSAILCVGFFKKYAGRFHFDKMVLFWILFCFLALAPYIGLGNVAERYGYLASAGMSILFIVFLGWMMRRDVLRGLLGVTLAVILYGGTILGNYNQLVHISQDWDKAGKTTATILLSMRKAYFPVVPKIFFVFSQVPTRIGRAWVFPVGLSDALWHIFRDDSIRVEVVGTPEEAIRIKEHNKENARALMIEGDHVKEIY